MSRVKLKTGGRKPGSKNKHVSPTAKSLEEIVGNGITPLEYMLNVMRDESAEKPRRDEMSKASAPYIHAKLAAIEHSGKGGGPIMVSLDNADAKA